LDGSIHALKGSRPHSRGPVSLGRRQVATRFGAEVGLGGASGDGSAIVRPSDLDRRSERTREAASPRKDSMAFKNLVILLLSRFLRSRLSSFLCRVAFRKPAFVITTNPGAFLGNQLTIYAHVIACAQECGREVWGPSFFMYAKHFESSSRDLFTRWPTRRSFLYPLQSLRVFLYYYVFARVVRVILLHPEPPVKDVTVITDYERKQSLESPEFLRETSGRRVVIIEGYFFRTSGSKVRAHALAIKEYFKPLKRHEARAAAVVRQARIGADVLVGVTSASSIRSSTTSRIRCTDIRTRTRRPGRCVTRQTSFRERR